MEEELHEGGYIPSTLPKKIFKQKDGNNRGYNNKKRYAEILKNAEYHLAVEEAQNYMNFK